MLTCIEMWKTTECQSNPGQEKQCWRSQHTSLQDALQSHSNKNCKAATKVDMQVNGIQEKTQKQTHMTTWFFTKMSKMYAREKTASSTNSAGENKYSHVKEWNRKQLKMDQRS